MTRLLSTVRWDIQLQARYGFYYAALVVAVIMIALAGYASRQVIALLAPVLLLTDLMITTFFFVAGLVLLEKSQRILEGLVVTPLRRSEYLAGKVISLTALALFESVLIVGLSYGASLRWGWLLLGVAMLSGIYVLLGFAFVARFRAINEYLMPSMVPYTLFSLPILPYFGLWSNPVLYLIPTQPALILLKAAFQPVAAWELGYAIGYGSLWLAIGFWLAHRAFRQFITPSM